jgi:hypothetical protein
LINQDPKLGHRNQSILPKWPIFADFSAGIEIRIVIVTKQLTAMNTLRAYRKYNEKLFLRLMITFALIGCAMLLLL